MSMHQTFDLVTGTKIWVDENGDEIPENQTPEVLAQIAAYDAKQAEADKAEGYDWWGL